jgi:hypothetical protein
VEAGLSATVGQDAVDRAMEAMMALTEARRALVAAHEALYDVQRRIGLRELNFGSLGEKPAWPEKQLASMPAPSALRIAA